MAKTLIFAMHLYRSYSRLLEPIKSRNLFNRFFYNSQIYLQVCSTSNSSNSKLYSHFYAPSNFQISSLTLCVQPTSVNFVNNVLKCLKCVLLRQLVTEPTALRTYEYGNLCHYDHVSNPDNDTSHHRPIHHRKSTSIWSSTSTTFFDKERRPR